MTFVSCRSMYAAVVVAATASLIIDVVVDAQPSFEDGFDDDLPTEKAQRCFPQDFLFGTATAAYQVEGSWNETGRTPSVWDEYCRKTPGLECADVADDFVNRFRDDIDLMSQMGVESFRMSISWSRVMTWDNASHRMLPNEPGIVFYHQVFDALRKQGITPIVTLYHWDLPAALYHDLQPNGWLNGNIVDHFIEYADLMFREFGDNVNFWATFNEPWVFALDGVATGGPISATTNGTTNAYLAAHHVLLAHAQAVELFRDLQAQKFVRDDAEIGIVLNFDYSRPLDPMNPQDIAAAERKNQFFLGWFLTPITTGDYPQIMKDRAGTRLPEFTPEQKRLLNGSYDVLMLNHYATMNVVDCGSPHSTIRCDSLREGWDRDLAVDDSLFPSSARRSSKNAKGEFLCDWFSAVPEGYLDAIRWTHEFDHDAPILLTENGWCGNEEIDNQDQLWYYQNYLKQVWRAIDEFEIIVIGYTAWSLLDNYEWGSYDPRFGLYFVNYTASTRAGSPPQNARDLARIPRLAAKWFAKVAQTKCLVDMTLEDQATVVTTSPSKASSGQVRVPTSSDRISSSQYSSIFIAMLFVVIAYLMYSRFSRSPALNSGEHQPLLHN